MDRKLAAILAADVVGYSAHMERDEQGTFERLKKGRKELFEPEIARHHGRVFKLMGDGMLAEFSSVVDAVECAVALQRGLAERNSGVPESERIMVRIGINLGEVIVEGDDRYGEGVNIATRLEQIAEPGGIYVSGKVAREVGKKLAFGFEPMGEQRVKNIAEPVAVFRIRIIDQPQVKARIFPLRRGALRWLAVAAALVAIVLTAGWFYLGRPQPDRPAAATGVPKVAVLAFDNMSGDPGFGYFSDGVSEDIITMLARSPDLSVVARNSSFAYKGTATDVRQVGKDLNVDYVLEGSVRKDGDKVRIVAQLVDSRTGEHVWAERFDKAGADPWVLQDEVTGKIIGSLTGEKGQLKLAQYRDAWGKDATQLGEYDYYLRGHDIFMNAASRADNDKAAAIWREGLEKFPDSGLLKIKLGWYHFQNVFLFWSDDAKREIDLAVELARDGLKGESVSPQVRRLGHFLLARALSAQGHPEAALQEAETARQLAPYDAFLLGIVSATFVENGQPQKALELLDDAAKREPGREAVYNYRRGWAYTVLGEKEKALASLEEGPDWVDVPLLKAINLVRLDKLDEARAQVKEALKIRPDFTSATWVGAYIYSDPKIGEAEVADLKKAGLPSGPHGP